MKILHIPFCFYPDPVGGTEIYVSGLAHEQQRDGHEVVICAPAAEDASYLHEGLAVRRFALSPCVSNVAELYDAGDRHAAARFGEILDQEEPDILHLHAFTRGASLRIIQEAKRRKIATVFSYHTPTVSCMRGTLLYLGESPCDGRLDIKRCAACNLESLGVSQPWNGMLAAMPASLNRSLSGILTTGRAATALRMTELVDLRHASFCALMRDVDRVVALCDWTRDLLVRNAVPAHKISVSRQGISGTALPAACVLTARFGKKPVLRVAFLGRLAPEKGLSVLLDALQTIPNVPVTLDVFGVSQEETTFRKIPALTDERICFRAPLSRVELLATLRTYDVVAVPSQWLETGPMVVMEAFAAGVPVIGSRLGGIAELVEHDVNGWLIGPRLVGDWAAAIAALAEDRRILMRLRLGIRKQRTMRDAAREIGSIYDQLNVTKVEQIAVAQ